MFPHTGCQVSGKVGSSAIPAGDSGRRGFFFGWGRGLSDSLSRPLSSPALCRWPRVHVGPLARPSPRQVQTRSGYETSLGCQHPQVGSNTAAALGVACHLIIKALHSRSLSRPFCLLHVSSQRTLLFLLRKQGCEGKWGLRGTHECEDCQPTGTKPHRNLPASVLCQPSHFAF